MSVLLRVLEPADAAWLDTWLPQVASAAGYGHADATSLLDRKKVERGFHARVIVRDGASVGVAAYRTQAKRAAIIELIAVSSEHARKGAGMAAAAVVEDGLRRAGVRAIFAPASAANGISMYFWIRLGFAPILRAEWPCDREGIAWLRRETLSP